VVSALPVDLEQHRSRRCHFLRAEAYALLTFEVVEIVSLLSWVSDSLDKRRVLARTCVRISARTSTSNPPRHGSRQSSHREDHVIGILHCVPSDACVQASGRCLDDPSGCETLCFVLSTPSMEGIDVDRPAPQCPRLRPLSYPANDSLAGTSVASLRAYVRASA
jgi:hypothetical protein